MQHFDLILNEIRTSVSSASFLYLMRLLEKSKDEQEPGTGVPEELEEKRSRSEKKWKLPLSNGDIDSERCTDIHICKKIVSKVMSRKTFKSTATHGSSSVTLAPSSSNVVTEGTQGNFYNELVGKIVEVTPPYWKRQKKDGVRQLDRPISNPLYKVYDPLGYVKTEDELGLEKIHEVVNYFNKWLGSFDGPQLQIDAQILYNILRLELEIPEFPVYYNLPSTEYSRP